MGLSPLTLAPLPPEAATPTGLFPAPCVPPLPAWPIRASLRSLPFPRQCANAAPTLSLSHCPVSGPHGGGHRPSRLARGVQVGTPTPVMGYGGRFGMTPCCIVLVCSWRHLLANRHSRPFPWTLSLHSMGYGGGGLISKGVARMKPYIFLIFPRGKLSDREASLKNVHFKASLASGLRS